MLMRPIANVTHTPEAMIGQHRSVDQDVNEIRGIAQRDRHHCQGDQQERDCTEQLGAIVRHRRIALTKSGP